MQSKADLHVHSKYSDRPSEWFLRRIGAPESFVEPAEIYERCRERGMDYVTITDHNRIDGALEISHLPGTFISAEVTTYFPENGCKIHCLVYDATPEDFEQIQLVRESIYDLRELLDERDILHSVAHPLFQPNGRLTVEQMEKLLVLFNRFEGLNGTDHPRAIRLFDALVRSLTPELLHRLAEKHGLEPRGAEPWRKILSGGSDDHSGAYVASAYTTTPEAGSVREFLDFMRQGRHDPAGNPGAALSFAHSLYHIGYGYYCKRLLNGSGARSRLMGEIFEKLLGKPETDSPTLRQRLAGLAGRVGLSVKKRTVSGTERALVEDFQSLFDGRADGSSMPPDAGSDKRAFRTACHLSQQFGYTFLQRCLRHASKGEILDCIETLAALGPVALGIAPYLAAFHALHKDAPLMEALAERFGLSEVLATTCRAAWLTDFVIEETVPWALAADDHPGKTLPDDITLLTCCDDAPACARPVRNFEPVGSFDLPEPDGREIAFPPFLEIVEHIERQGFTELVLSTPGPMGLTGLLAARLLGLKTTGVCGESVGRAVVRLTEDHDAAQLGWRYAAWFYGQTDEVIAGSEACRRLLLRNGLDPTKTTVGPCRPDASESASPAATAAL